VSRTRGIIWGSGGCYGSGVGRNDIRDGRGNVSVLSGNKPWPAPLEANVTWETLLEGSPIPIQLKGVAPWRLPGVSGGTGLLLRTNRGSIRCLFHGAEDSTKGIIWAGGSNFNGAGGLYPILSDELVGDGISSLRMSYRERPTRGTPEEFMECVLDVLVGIMFFQERGYQRIALVGHSLGGAVVIAAAPIFDSVMTVVSLASQTYGAQHVSLVSPRPILLVHGEGDTRLGPERSKLIYDTAREPKELVLYPGAGHSLVECRDQLHPLLRTWLVDKFNVGDSQGQATPSH